jgi:hypothetical protein
LKTALIEKAVLPEGPFVPGSDPLDGIINQLTRRCGGNVADHGLVGIRSASVNDDNGLPRNAADLGPVFIFQTMNEANQWIEWDFKTAQIEATHYSIFTHGGKSGSSHLRNWVLEGRNGHESWTVLDERRDDSQLNGKDRIVTFNVKTRLRVRVIRLRQTGVTHSGNRMLAFCALEFFGGLFRNGSDDWRLQCIRSLTDEFTQLKTALIDVAVLPERTFVPAADPLDGIISQLTQTCGGNVADHGLVGIRSASVLRDGCFPRNAADLRPGPIFSSKDEPNQWIEWDFKTTQIEATHYSIFTHASESGGCHLRNWVLEGRNGDEAWTVLDERRDD